MRTMSRRAGALAALLGVWASTGCVPGAQGETCVDWVLFDAPVDAAQGALVVRAAVIGPDGSDEVWGVEATRWEVDVAEVLVGRGAESGRRIEVLSSPQTCHGGSGAYPQGDPLDVEGDVVLILHDDEEHGLRTVTPFDGVVAPGPDGGLPDRWPENHRSRPPDSIK